MRQGRFFGRVRPQSPDESRSKTSRLHVSERLAYLERVSRGLLDCGRQHCDGSFTRVPEMLNPAVDWLRHWPGDGAFNLVINETDARLARALRFPVVNLAGRLADTGRPTVTVDYAARGRLAAAHLLERHCQRFGFCGTRDRRFSEQRREAFSEQVRRAGHRVAVLEFSGLGPC
jgi:hypothetical protein